MQNKPWQQNDFGSGVKSFLGTFVLQQEQHLYTPSNMAQVHKSWADTGQWKLQAAPSCIAWLIDKTYFLMLTFDFDWEQAESVTITHHPWHRTDGSLKGPCTFCESWSNSTWVQEELDEKLKGTQMSHHVWLMFKMSSSPLWLALSLALPFFSSESLYVCVNAMYV